MLNLKRGLAYIASSTAPKRAKNTKIELADLPPDTVRLILRFLPLRQQVQCEEVCKGWMMILRGLHDDSTRDSEPPSGTGDLKLTLRGPSNSLGPVLLGESGDQDSPVPHVLMMPNDHSQSPKESAFFRWFARVAPTLATVIVNVGHHSADWQADGLQDFNGGSALPKILAILEAAKQSAPSGPMLKLSTGTNIFLEQPFALMTLTDILVEWEVEDIGSAFLGFSAVASLTMLTRLVLSDPSGTFSAGSQDMLELRFLPALQALVLQKVSRLDFRIPNFTNLQSLVLEQGSDAVCDLSSLTLLTALELHEELPDDHLRIIVLPRGRDVRLQTLQCDFDHAKGVYEMQNLESASQLTDLHLSGVAPEGLKCQEWPAAMASLKHLVYCNCTEFPISICSCIRLKFLDLANINDITLPDGFSSLTKLEVLNLQGCQFETFPRSVLQLSQLQILDMHHLYNVTLPTALLVCAAWPNLDLLDLTLFEDEVYGMDSQLVLIQLKNAFKARNKKSTLVTNDIYLL